MNDLFLAPLVVSQRLPLLWLESLGIIPTGPRESERMIAEKMDAVSQGVIAAQVEMVRTSIAVGTALICGNSAAAAAIRGSQLVTQAAFAPGNQKIRGNVERFAALRTST